MSRKLILVPKCLHFQIVKLDRFWASSFYNFPFKTAENKKKFQTVTKKDVTNELKFARQILINCTYLPSFSFLAQTVRWPKNSQICKIFGIFIYFQFFLDIIIKYYFWNCLYKHKKNGFNKRNIKKWYKNTIYIILNLYIKI